MRTEWNWILWGPKYSRFVLVPTAPPPQTNNGFITPIKNFIFIHFFKSNHFMILVYMNPIILFSSYNKSSHLRSASSSIHCLIFKNNNKIGTSYWSLGIIQDILLLFKDPFMHHAQYFRKFNMALDCQLLLIISEWE